MSNTSNNFQSNIPASNNHGGCSITFPNASSRKSVVFSNSGDTGDMTGPEISIIRNGNNSVCGGNDGGQSASQNGMD